MRSYDIKKVLCFVVILCLFVSVNPANAQEDTGIDGTLTNATINIDASDTTRVNATYEFQLSGTSGQSSQQNWINGTIWKFTNGSISGISTRVNGRSASAHTERNSRFINLSFPINSTNSGSTTVEVRYRVEGPRGQLKAPLWVPELQTSGTETVVDMSVRIPEGTRLQGDAFPTVDNRVTNNRFRYDIRHMPGFVSMNYEEDANSMFTLNNLLTVVGLGFICGFLAIWGAFREGYLSWRRK